MRFLKTNSQTLKKDTMNGNPLKKHYVKQLHFFSENFLHFL